MTDLRPEQDTKHNIPNLSLDPISQEEVATSPSTDNVFFFLFFSSFLLFSFLLSVDSLFYSFSSVQTRSVR